MRFSWAVGMLWMLVVLSAGCVVSDHDTNRPDGYETAEQFDVLFEKIKKGNSWEETEGILQLRFKTAVSVIVKTGPGAILEFFGDIEEAKNLFLLDSPEEIEGMLARTEVYTLVRIPWRDVVRKHDRLYVSTQEFSEHGVDHRYLILFKKEGERLVVQDIQPARETINKHRKREAFLLIVTDLFGLPTITPDLPDAAIPGAKIKP